MGLLDIFGSDALKEESEEQKRHQHEPGKAAVQTRTPEHHDDPPRALNAKPRPWIRFIARQIDGLVLGMPVGIIIGFVSASTDSGAGLLEENPLLRLVVMVLPLIFVEAAMLSSWGTTPGKKLFGIAVYDDRGKRPTFGIALARTVLVWWRGLALGIPLVAIFTMNHAYSVLVKTGKTSWDRDLHLKVVTDPAHRAWARE